ncbi:hypothetical protein F511_23952 [Dorcoceras hygrometricum]|uniref:Uncharacterized protein n=1 Tax=Dorcoceras hygrometricum TaxID=472368 RepID=A0A2Z7BN90_9LAMI|nr:hypothetical protein F511_23952 [Dorcoceras hygrometricum]
MQAHLAAQNDDMWEVITNGPLKIMKANPTFAITGGAPEWIEKSRAEYTTEDKKKANLDNVAKDILYKTLDKDITLKHVLLPRKYGRSSPKSAKAMMEKSLLQKKATNIGETQIQTTLQAVHHQVITNKKKSTA